jgi:hypothetical protein
MYHVGSKFIPVPMHHGHVSNTREPTEDGFFGEDKEEPWA